MADQVLVRGAPLALGLWLAACSTDTSGLARQAPPARVAGGAAGAPPASGGGELPVSGGGGGAPVDAELGPGAIGLVHGIVDGGQLFVCRREAGSGELVGGDTPEPPGGLAYGAALDLPIDWAVADASVEIHLFAGTPSAVAGWTCEDLIERAEDADALALLRDGGVPDAGVALAPFPTEPATPRRAGALQLPPGALRADRFYALIATGCAAPGSSPEQDICGAPDPFGSSRGLVFVQIAAPTAAGPDSVGLQFVNASRAVARAGVVLQSETGQNPVVLGDEVPFGAVRPPSPAIVREPIGVELLQTVTRSGFTQLWQDALEAGGAPSAAPGASYLLAYLGPAPGPQPDGVSPPRFVLIRGR